jgi:hypothetical protein
VFAFHLTPADGWALACRDQCGTLSYTAGFKPHESRPLQICAETSMAAAINAAMTPAM